MTTTLAELEQTRDKAMLRLQKAIALRGELQKQFNLTLQAQDTEIAAANDDVLRTSITYLEAKLGSSSRGN